MQKKYSHLLEDENVKRWYENVSRGSKITADVYLRRLGNLCETNNTTPAELSKLDEKRIYELMLDMVSDMEKKNFAGSYIKSVLKAIKSWFAFNDKEIRKKINIKGVEETPTLQNERVPTQEELKRIFLSGDEKNRVACVLVAHSGLRLEVLGNYDGSDGLKIVDFPEMEVKNGTVEFKKIPTMIRVRSALSKKSHEYFTFLSSEGCEYLKSYLEMRIRNGEKSISAIITPKTAKNNFITTINIGDIIRKAIRQAGFGWRPYVLRSYFDTQMMLAESKGLIIRDYRTFWMGHKGDIEHVYTLNKRRLPKEHIEEMRESYRKAQKFLQTGETEKDEEDIKKMFKKELLLVAGLKPEDINDEQLEMSDEDFHKVIREKLIQQVSNNGNRQKVVGVHEVENYLASGWEFVSVLPNNRAVLKLPESM
jgi:site-specific recombinase XerD